MQYIFTSALNTTVSAMPKFIMDMVILDRDAALISDIYTVEHHLKCQNFDESIIHQDWMGFSQLANEGQRWVFGKQVQKYFTYRNKMGKTKTKQIT